MWLRRDVSAASVASFLDVRRSDDRPPARDLTSDQRRKPRLSPLGLVGNIAPKLEQALAHDLIVERSIECVCELVEDRLRRAPWRKQAVPRRHLKVGQPRFDRG